jgi:hypothetical protein
VSYDRGSGPVAVGFYPVSGDCDGYVVSVQVSQDFLEVGLQNIGGVRFGAAQSEMPSVRVRSPASAELPVESHEYGPVPICVNSQVIVLALGGKSGLKCGPPVVTVATEEPSDAYRTSLSRKKRTAPPR